MTSRHIHFPSNSHAEESPMGLDPKTSVANLCHPSDTTRKFSLESRVSSTVRTCDPILLKLYVIKADFVPKGYTIDSLTLPVVFSKKYYEFFLNIIWIFTAPICNNLVESQNNLGFNYFLLFTKATISTCFI